ncbi:hypothetical protein [Saccharopolyspora sp. 6M]|uniref:hypothetical protein n=1 Tax=Saccharopolyspora sp. 6M TaxID=2877237 RepID=UPI001CD5DDE0|nr:hypothetical protein [Saccharopolyspora sp. 6M]MCA1226859.1 hypothetical protein [Saccharopolyspora sp. 6M]
MRTGSLPAPAPPGADRWLRGLLHDLGHGLAAASYLTEGMRSEAELPAQARDRLELVHQELVRLLELVSAGGAPGEPVAVELRGLLGGLAASRAGAGAPTLLVHPGAPVHVRADPAAVWRMLANLLDNAARAAGGGGGGGGGGPPPPPPAGGGGGGRRGPPRRPPAARGGARGGGGRGGPPPPRGGAVTAEVVDDGPGLGRAPAAGSGLGLGIVTALAQSCGARLHLDPAPRRGTRARLVFPAA